MSSLVWTTDRPNLLAPDQLATVAHALLRGIVFGYHLHFFGGSSLTRVVFQDYGAYLRTIHRSRPGDLYVLWSLPDLLHKQLALVTKTYSGASDHLLATLSHDEIEAIKDYLSTPFNEILYLASGAVEHTDVQMRVDDSDGYDSLLEIVDQCSHPDGFIHVFPTNIIDRPEHWLLQAKYPNAKGEVPIGGAY